MYIACSLAFIFKPNRTIYTRRFTYEHLLHGGSTPPSSTIHKKTTLNGSLFVYCGTEKANYFAFVAEAKDFSLFRHEVGMEKYPRP